MTPDPKPRETPDTTPDPKSRVTPDAMRAPTRKASAERRHRGTAAANATPLHDDRCTGAYREREVLAREHHMSARHDRAAADGDDTDHTDDATYELDAGSQRSPLQAKQQADTPAPPATPRWTGV
ncbi:hypothetical protein [uncultured Schumannella sp.]|uniref:hypothetical protein n=1 Tax=uncultured Schumannella sp. TaxID=1195956 RepID=UPI0025CC080F|nr:hypothetical protein [uncultured Schumannella sp.]